MNVRGAIDENTLESVSSCLVCGSSDHSELFDARDTLHDAPGTWTVRRCARCGHGFTSPRPDVRSIGAYYPAEYSPFSAPIAPERAGRRASSLRNCLRRFFDPHEYLLPSIEFGTALEVGCGSGRFLADLHRRGWRIRGLEPSRQTAHIARETVGAPVDCGTVSDADYPAGSFDLVIALMVLEHLHDPMADVRRIIGWIRPGGFFMGSVPNAASWEFRVFGPDWYALQVPTHLSHFTPGSLTRLLTTAGFERPRVLGQRNLNNLMMQLGRALQHHRWPGARTCLAYPMRGSRLLRLALWPLASALAFIGQSGRMTFIARRPCIADLES